MDLFQDKDERNVLFCEKYTTRADELLKSTEQWAVDQIVRRKTRRTGDKIGKTLVKTKINKTEAESKPPAKYGEALLTRLLTVS